MDSLDIKELRTRLKLTQEALAHKLGVSFCTVNRWERKGFTPSNLALDKIKQLLEKEGKSS